MPLTRYQFKNAVNGFFEMPRENAREILPPHLQPFELRHGQGVLAVTAFDFTQSMVGPYTELVLAVIVPPMLRSGQPMPKSAFFPFVVATSTAAARAHALERWHLPHFMKDIAVDFEESGGRMSVRVREAGGGSILDVKISQHSWVDADDPYQSFMHTNEKRYKVDVQLKGRFTEHEEESGELTIYDHPMCDKLHVDGIATYPFREMWMKDGVQTFQELETI